MNEIALCNELSQWTYLVKNILINSTERTASGAAVAFPLVFHCFHIFTENKNRFLTHKLIAQLFSLKFPVRRRLHTKQSLESLKEFQQFHIVQFLNKARLFNRLSNISVHVGIIAIPHKTVSFHFPISPTFAGELRNFFTFFHPIL